LRNEFVLTKKKNKNYRACVMHTHGHNKDGVLKLRPCKKIIINLSIIN